MSAWEVAAIVFGSVTCVARPRVLSEGVIMALGSGS